MSQFEYLAIAVSLILTLSATRFLGGLPGLLKREGTYWVHSLWVLQALLNVFVYWWLFWTWHEFDGWNLATFLLILMYPSATYVGATILIPSQIGSSMDWRSYFLDVARRPFFTIAAIGTLLSMSVQMAFVLPESEQLGALTVGGYFILLYVIGFWTRNSHVQAALVAANLVGIAVVYAPGIFVVE